MSKAHIEKGLASGSTCAADEQTTSMQEKSECKVCCSKYKWIGDDIHTDCIADDGYTRDFYFRNEPDVYHCIDMDNLFNSVLLCIGALHFCSQKVLTQGVMRRNGRGVPLCVTQEPLYGKRADAACGTIKEAVPQGESHADAI
eukprot:6977482-Ditylum_brightwellii.AAC.1